MRKSLDIEADLILSGETGEVRLRGAGRRLTGDVDRPGILRALARFGPGRAGRRSIHRLHRLLAVADVDLAITCRTLTIARLGPWARPGLASTLLGCAPLELRPWAWILATVRTLLRGA